jgi:hypothetical protein
MASSARIISNHFPLVLAKLLHYLVTFSTSLMDPTLLYAVILFLNLLTGLPSISPGTVGAFESDAWGTQRLVQGGNWRKKCRILHNIPQLTHFTLHQACLAQGAISHLPGDLLVRRSPQGRFVSPLALSGSRGVAAAFTDCMRGYMLDLEDDGAGDEGEGQEDQEGDEDDISIG